jgi:YbgC/YbaW family acyl-CoA thioester hydrolase
MNASHGRNAEHGKVFEFRITRRVEFCETDMAGIMHFSNFFRFMEAAETAFLRSLGLSVLLSRCGLDVCLPRVHAECDYNAPLHFEDEVLVHLLVERKGTRSLTYQFRFCRSRGADPRQVAFGRLVLACATRMQNGALKAVPLPRLLADKIQQAPAQLLAGGCASLQNEVAPALPTFAEEKTVRHARASAGRALRTRRPSVASSS